MEKEIGEITGEGIGEGSREGIGEGIYVEGLGEGIVEEMEDGKGEGDRRKSRKKNDLIAVDWYYSDFCF